MSIYSVCDVCGDCGPCTIVDGKYLCDDCLAEYEHEKEEEEYYSDEYLDWEEYEDFDEVVE